MAIAIASILCVSCSAVKVGRYQSRMPEQPLVELMNLAPIPHHAASDDLPVEKKFRNIEVLQGLPSSQMYPMMSMFANSLGVTCAHCHTELFEDESRREKEVAREMIRLTRAINRVQFQGEPVVTCYTCHNGKKFPRTRPRIADAGWQPASREQVAAPELPNLDTILGRYAAVNAARNGAAPASGRGTVKIVGGLDEATSGTFELVKKDDGVASVRASIGIPGPARTAIVRFACGSLDLRAIYRDLRVSHHELHDGKNVVVVAAQPASGDLPDFLSFDLESGELIRIQTGTATAMGFAPEEVLFRNYRTIDGIAVAESISWARGDFFVTFDFSHAEVLR